MPDVMMFPDTVEEFMESYKVVDVEHVYSNGVEFVPIYRMRQWFQHQPERKKGKWIDETFKPWGLVYHPYKCDQCGEHSEADSDFCPNCGADMRGESNEAD